MSKTKRKWLLRIGCLVLFLFVAAALILPTTRIRIFGYLRGEAFFDGMPTSYWRSVVKERQKPQQQRTPNFWDRVLAYLGMERPPRERMAAPTRGAAVPVLLELLSDDEPRIRLFAADILRLSDRNAALATVTELLDHEDPAVRLSAAGILQRFDGSIADAVPSLMRNFDRDIQWRYGYFSALERLGSDARPALPSLIQLLSAKPDFDLARVVWSIDPDNALARSILKQALLTDQRLPSGHQVSEQMLLQFYYHRQAPQARSLILEVLNDPDVELSAERRLLLLDGVKFLEPEPTP